ncbi:MAG TPA: hypothetical protein VGY32_07700, partial [Solirubrobacteraceae bacterium]|nr:hypothetical protein [Solirubrobacteraceae bacterium]
MIAALVAAAAAALSLGAPGAGPSTARAGDATARVSGAEVVLRDSRIVHRWGIDGAGHVWTMQLSD